MAYITPILPPYTIITITITITMTITIIIIITITYLEGVDIGFSAESVSCLSRLPRMSQRLRRNLSRMPARRSPGSFPKPLFSHPFFDMKHSCADPEQLQDV